MRSACLGVLAVVSILSACGAPPARPAPPRKSLRARAPAASASSAPVAVQRPPPQPLLDPLAPLPQGAIARCGTTRMRFVESPKSVAVTNDGVVIAVEPRRGARLVVRDLQRGVELATLPHAGEVSLSPGGDVVALALSKPEGDIAFHRTQGGAHEGTVHIQLPQTSRTARGRLWMETARVTDLLWSGDGKRVAAALSSGGPTYVIDAVAHKLLSTVTQKGRLVGMSRAGDRGLLVEFKYEFFSSEAKAVSVVELATGRVLRRIEFKPPAPAAGNPDAAATAELSGASFGLSGGGASILAFEHGELFAIDVATSKRDKLLERPESRNMFGLLGSFGLSSQRALTVSPDGMQVVLHRDYGNIAFNLADFTERRLGDDTPQAFSPDSQLVVSTSARSASVSGAHVDVPQGHEGPVKALAFVAQGAVLASGGDGLRMWDARSCEPLQRTQSQGDIARLAASSDGARLVVLGSKLRIVSAGGKVQTLELREQVTAMAVSRDGADLALGLSRYDTGKSLRIVRRSGDGADAALDNTVESAAFSPDGAALAVLTDKTWSDEKESKASLTVRNAATLEVQATLPEELAEDAAQVAFGQSADVLLVGRQHRGMRMFDRKRQAVTRRFGWEGCCSAITVSPDGSLVAAAAGNDAVVWETATRRMRGVARGHSDDILSLAFSPDGSKLASGSEDTTVLMWDVAQLRKPEPPSTARELPAIASVRALARSDRIELAIDAQGKLAYVEGATKRKLPDPGKVRQLVSPGLSHCALLETGKVSCWGYTRSGILGTPEEKRNKTIADRDRPVEVPGIADVASLAGGHTYVCALSRRGELRCWGVLASGFGSPGDAALKSQDPAPHAISGLPAVSSVSVGEGHACASAASGKVFCWGAGGNGQLGNGTTDSSLAPVEVAGIDDASSVACGDQHCCAVRRDGSVWCWGANEHDELGAGEGMDSARALRVPGVEQAVEVASTDRVTCVRSSGGAVTCWGRSWTAPLSFAEPTELRALAGASAIDVRTTTVCADMGGKVKCLQ